MSEPVSVQFSFIKVLDRARREQPVGPVTTDASATALRAPLAQALAPGTYTVVWRIISGVDGHVTAGSYAFRVLGAAKANTAGTPEPEVEPTPVPGAADTLSPYEGSAETPDPLRWIIRAIMLGGMLFVVGGTAFSFAVAEPASRELASGDGQVPALVPALTRRFGRMGSTAVLLLIVAMLLDLLFQIASLGASGLGGALGSGPAALSFLTTTRFGLAWGVKLLAALAVLGVMIVAWQRGRVGRRGTGGGLPLDLWDLSLVASVVVLVAEALGSHSAAVHAADQHGGAPHLFTLPMLSDLAHLIVAALWVGGLGYMALVFFPVINRAGLAPEERRALLGRAVPRFSRLAVFSVASLLITGTYNLLVHSTDVGAILGSGYGQVLAIKIGAFTLLTLIGAVNLLRLTPLLRRPSANPGEGVPSPSGGAGGIDVSPMARLRRNVRAEVALSVLALLCAGGLTLLPPPGDMGGESTASAGMESTPSTSPTMPGGMEAAEPQPTIPQVATPAPASARVSVGGYTLTLTTRASLEGDELRADILPAGPASPALTDVSKVLFRVTPQDIDAGSTSYEAAPAGTNSNNGGSQARSWSATEPIFTLDGVYRVVVIVQRTSAPDLKAAFRLELSEAGGLKAYPDQVVEVRVDTLPSPPISGTATLTVTLVDGENKPVPGATVSINPLMPAHAHAEPRGEVKPLPGRPGVYRVPVNFVMSGPWLLIFSVDRPGLPPLKLDASVDVADSGATATPAPK